MKKTVIIISVLIGFLSFGQERNISHIEDEARLIDLNDNLTKKEFNWVELTEITTDGGGILKVWQDENQICKIYEEIGFSYGRITTIIYLKDNVPIKIIDTEENFSYENDDINYYELNEVFKATIYVFDWEDDDTEIIIEGNRVISEGNCSTFEYESIIELAEKALTD